ncbi:16120_t:CDS:2 [Cetraspora pellucida]|uniref:16120_t:CDS:1 n=1 Tax=Cetraspora pellucida TaxID=1433469 RepID=A0ACA9K0X4_9GLOM|nr:16120_t:CDS:2 [Cetraspora pellucida]
MTCKYETESQEKGEASERSEEIAEKNSDNWLNFSSKEAILELRDEISDSREETLFKRIFSFSLKLWSYLVVL